MKKRLEKLKAINKEIESIKREMVNADRNREIVADVVTGSTPEYPWIETHFKVLGTSENHGRRLLAKLAKAQREVEAVENWIEQVDSAEMRAILRDYYINGLTHEEIAGIYDVERSTITKRLERFWEARECGSK